MKNKWMMTRSTTIQTLSQKMSKMQKERRFKVLLLHLMYQKYHLVLLPILESRTTQKRRSSSMTLRYPCTPLTI
jgi:hypothetical protein